MEHVRLTSIPMASIINFDFTCILGSSSAQLTGFQHSCVSGEDVDSI